MDSSETVTIGSQSDTKIGKASPFVLLNDAILDRLVEVSIGEPSVADMVTGYRASLETISMYSEIIADECAHYQIPLMSPVV